MSQEFGTPTTPQPAASLSWSEVWINALTQPSVATYEDFVRDPDATSQRAYKWMFLSALIGIAVSVVLSTLLATAALGTASGFGPLAAGGSLLSLICIGPIGAALAVLGFALWAGLTQWAASRLGGTGAYSQLAYAFASFAAPLALITSVLGSIPYINYLNYIVWVYEIVLSVIAVKAVNRLEWGRTIGSIVLAYAVIIFFVAVLIICPLLLLGPIIGNVFSNIVALTPVP